MASMAASDASPATAPTAPPPLLLRGGHVIDPAGGVDGPADVSLADGRVAAVGPSLQPVAGATVLDCAGRYVCPGLIDLHGHFYEGSAYGIDPRHELRGGVTTAVDAGTTGFINFADFRRHTIDGAAVRILPFIHIGCLGIPTAGLGELLDLRYARPKETAAMARAHADIVPGIKVRAGVMARGHNAEALQLAIDAAEEAKIRVMVHISREGDTERLLQMLRPGDIVTHCFTGKGGGILHPDSGDLAAAAAEARRRGVVFDVGHGSGSFRWTTAQKAFEHQFYPDTISTDLHRYNADRTVYDLLTTMSKFLLLGMSIQEVVAKATLAPAGAIGREADLGSLAAGRSADVCVFAVETGEFQLEDSLGVRRSAERRLVAEHVVVGGQLIDPRTVQAPLRELNDMDQEVYDMSAATAADAPNY